MRDAAMIPTDIMAELMRLADEMGLYLDGWERMGMLENQGLRAARLVTDQGRKFLA